MSDWDIPEAFRHVDLTDPTTWHYASIFDWFAMRDEIMKKGPSEKEREVLPRILIRANKKLDAEEKRDRGRKPGPYLSGRQEARLGVLVSDLMNKSHVAPQSISPWERKFIVASEWVESVRNNFRDQTPTAAAIRVLCEMAANNESDLQSLRADRQRRMTDSIASTSGRGLPGGRIAYLPGPIELLQIYRLAALFVTHLKEAVQNAHELKLKADKFGCAYPCTECGEKFDDVTGARACCGSERVMQKYGQLHPVVVPGSLRHREHLRAFVHFLWQFEYPTARTLDEFVDWPEWKQIRSTSAANFSRAMLAFLFAAKPESIRRKLTRGELEAEYAKHHIPDELRYYPDKIAFGRVHAEMSPCRWYERSGMSRDGQSVNPPNKRMGVYQWSSTLSYRSPLFQLFAVPARKGRGGDD